MQIGFVRQALSTAGFIGGLLLGAFIRPHAVALVTSQSAKGLVAGVTVMGVAIIGLSIGEYLGIRIKHRVHMKRINKLDEIFGSMLAVITLLVSAWLLAALSQSLSMPGLQTAVDESRIIRYLNNTLPDAPRVVVGLGKLIDPNGFPDVFAGVEPRPNTNVDLPSLGDLKDAVVADQNSIVKIIGQGCGGIVDGTGFVASPGYIATNAHVVAGIHAPKVLDANGTHKSTVVWFDPNKDFAVLKVDNLAGDPLPLAEEYNDTATAIAVLGYPGGGPFTAKPGAILDHFKATGRNIYGRNAASRDVYEIRAEVKPGNSGGPIVDIDGTVVGMVFAESTSYENVGYALTAKSILPALDSAVQRNQPASTARCAE